MFSKSFDMVIIGNIISMVSLEIALYSKKEVLFLRPQSTSPCLSDVW